MEGLHRYIIKFTVFCLALAFASPAFAALSAKEKERVQKLLATVEKKADITFIRNGSEYNASEAAAHLLRKLNAAKDKINTAEEFIDKVASYSSMSGKPYLIKNNGKEETANTYFHALLNEVAPNEKAREKFGEKFGEKPSEKPIEKNGLPLKNATK